ncbi:MAG: hypothetical protein IPK81_24155 [Rhodospirillales bacterium]|nr:MAG: hypothetical protein IPK81_24155 [Rhodospirillales bacterium]
MASKMMTRRGASAAAMAGAAVALAAGPARADALDDALAWLTEIGAKDHNKPFTKESLAKLYSISLGTNEIAAKLKPDDLKHLAALPALRSLDLSNKAYGDDMAAAAAKLANIQSLNMGGENQLTDKALLEIGRMVKLESLTLSGSLFAPSKYTAAGVKALAALPNLQTLDLSQSSFGDAGLIELKAAPKLRSLNIIGAKGVGRPGLEALAAIKTLRRLVLQWVEVDEEVEALTASTAIEDIVFMGAFNTKKHFTDAGGVQLAKMKQLTSVAIWHTKVTDKTLVALAALPRLRTLIVSKTEVTDAGFAPFAKHATLATVWASETKLTGAGMAHFAAMPKLGSLSIDDTKVTNAGLLTLAANAALTSVSARKTGVDDAGIAKAKEVNPKLRVSK